MHDYELAVFRTVAQSWGVRPCTMKFAWWIHKYEYQDTVEKDADSILHQLAEYYRASSRSVGWKPQSDSLEVERGSLFFSFTGICPETWCQHFLRVRLERVAPQRTVLRWDIEMKLCGATAGKNYLVDECKKVVEML